MELDPRAGIRRAGLRATRARLAVLALLSASSQPMSHGEVVEALGHSGFDQATLYRNLVDLTEAGLLRHALLGERVQRYELATARHQTTARHAHFVCVCCGAICCLPAATVILDAERASLPRCVREATVDIQLRGTCDDCLEA